MSWQSSGLLQLKLGIGSGHWVAEYSQALHHGQRIRRTEIRRFSSKFAFDFFASN